MILPLLTEDALRLPTLSTAFYRLLMHIVESSPLVFLSLHESLIKQLLDCLGWAITGAAGLEPTRLALETITVVARTLAHSSETMEGPFTFALFKVLGAVCVCILHVVTKKTSGNDFRSCSRLHFIAPQNSKWSCICRQFAPSTRSSA